MASRLQSDNTSITVMLLGKTGAGKSLLGNRLLGLNEDNFCFRIGEGPARETIAADFSSNYISRESVDLTVFDTPGFFDDKDIASERWLDVLRTFDLANGVIDALVIVINIQNSQFKSGIDVMKILMGHFHRLTKYAVVVFTHCIEGKYDEREVLSKFNKHYYQGTAGISFVFSDQHGTREVQERALEDIMHYIKEIKQKKPLVSRDFESFFAHNLAANVKAIGVQTSIISFQSLKEYENLEIDLARRYVREHVLQKSWEKVQSTQNLNTRRPMKQGMSAVSVACCIALLFVLLGILIAFYN